MEYNKELEDRCELLEETIDALYVKLQQVVDEKDKIGNLSKVFARMYMKNLSVNTTYGIDGRVYFNIELNLDCDDKPTLDDFQAELSKTYPNMGFTRR